MKKATIINIIENRDAPEFNNSLFMIISEGHDTIISEKGEEIAEYSLTGYPASLQPNNAIIVNPLIKYTFLASNLNYNIVCKCSYVLMPKIIMINETKN